MTAGACSYDFDQFKSPSSADSAPPAPDVEDDAPSSDGAGGTAGEGGGSGGSRADAGDASTARDAAEDARDAIGDRTFDTGAGDRIGDSSVDASSDAPVDAGFDCTAVQGTTHGGHCYWGSSTAVSWDDAENISCATADHKGHLVTITSLDEQTFAQGILGSTERWIGLRKSAFTPATELLFHWVTSEMYDSSTSYRNWQVYPDGGKEPNFTSDSGGSGTTAGVDCVLLRTTGAWADDACAPTGSSARKLAALCEHD